MQQSSSFRSKKARHSSSFSEESVAKNPVESCNCTLIGLNFKSNQIGCSKNICWYQVTWLFFYNLCHLASLLICTIARIEVPFTQNVIHVTKCTIDSQYQSLDCIFKFSDWYYNAFLGMTFPKLEICTDSHWCDGVKIPWLKMIIRVIGVLWRTAVGDWRFDNLRGSHLQSQIIRFWRWLPHRLSKRQSPKTFLLKTPTTQTIIIFQSRYVTPGCKPFSYLCENCNHVLPAWIASTFFRDSYSLCNRLFFVFVVVFFFKKSR